MQILTKGMYIRVPVESRPDDHDYRDYRVGQIISINHDTATVMVQLEVHAPYHPPALVKQEFAISVVERCHLSVDAPFTHAITKERGRILIVCEDAFRDGQLCDYYVQLKGGTARLSEADMSVRFTGMDVDPRQQLYRYELHSPIWRSMRDDIVESYCQLNNATFGIEDLVGSRIMLLPHQAEVIARVLSDTTCRYILADEVGLGKTIEASVILKGLRRRNSALKTLIVTPSSLQQQWRNELNGKFWLNFALAQEVLSSRGSNPLEDPLCLGMIVSAEELETSGRIWDWLRSLRWDLLIVDEAHHLWKTAQLYDHVHTLSQRAGRALILSATPIQRRTEEYLALLRLMDPSRYDGIDLEAFRSTLSSQERIRRTIAYLSRALTPEDFDAQEFSDEMRALGEDLAEDKILAELVADAEARAGSKDRGLAAAKEAIAYVSENYRIEGRVIRNRRRHLIAPLPERELDISYAYQPQHEEAAALEALYEYISYALESDPSPLRTEHMRVILHAAASSPYALVALLQQRATSLLTPRSPTSDQQIAHLITPAAPRQEPDRIAQLARLTHPLEQEMSYLDRAIWATREWRDQTDQVLGQPRGPSALQSSSPHRLIQVIRAIHSLTAAGETGKVLVFTAWPQTLSVLLDQLIRSFGKSCVAQFRVGLDVEQLQSEATRFQSDDSCRILLCDELGGEGRNFQIAQMIIHVDLPWTPAQIEQRIGRVDRLGRSGTVTSTIPYAIGSLEHSLFDIWQQAFQLFTQSMSGMEIALEGVQNNLADALRRDIWHGLADLLPDMSRHAEQIRADVEEERYFEEGAINHRRRREFQEVSDRYRDGRILREAFLKWARVAGLRYSYNPHTNIVRFNPHDFSLKSMEKAKFFDPPNMTDALARSGRMRNLVINGTFNREIAVQREELVFYAPGSDSWIDAILANAQEADNGRCCGILREAPELEEDWQGFELLYSLSVNPRPLYALAQDPSHLLRAQGFLAAPTLRLLITSDGEVERRSQIRNLVRRPWDKDLEPHLGKRDGPRAQLPLLKQRYPPSDWKLILDRALAAAQQALDEELDFTPDLADEAREELERQLMGTRASQRWLTRLAMEPDRTENVGPQEQIVEALIEGIRRPLVKLESACFWMLAGRK